MPSRSSRGGEVIARGDDSRFSLFNRDTRAAIYLHKGPGPGESMDSISGPFLSIDELSSVPGVSPIAANRITATHRIERFHVSEIAADEKQLLTSLSFIPYEKTDPNTDPSIVIQRTGVDDLLVPCPMADAPRALVERAADAFGRIIDGLFRRTICSMIRIVISGCWEDYPDRVAITVRDCEKRSGDPASIAVLNRRNDGRIASNVQSSNKPSSGSVTATAFHSRFAFGILLHAHLLAPVLLDRPTDKLTVIDEAPRSEEFGIELKRLFDSGYPWVLRRSEGIWCYGASPEVVIASAVACQEHAMGLL